MVVVLVMGIMASVAAPKFADSVHYHQVDAAAKRILLELEHARKRAKATGSSQTVQFILSTHQMRLNNVADMDRQGSTYVVDLRLAPYRSRLTQASFGGDATVIFNGYGIPDSSGTVLVTSGQRQRTITLDGVTGYATLL